MNTPPAPNPSKRHRFPVDIISHCVWLYLGFPEYWNKKRRSFATHWIY
jgi:transposase-like protein